MTELYNITKDLYNHLFEKNTFRGLSKTSKLLLLQSFLVRVYKLNKNGDYIEIDKALPLKDMKDNK